MQSELAIHIPFGVDIMQYALDNWPTSHVRHRGESKTGPFYYTAETYQKIDAQKLYSAR